MSIKRWDLNWLSKNFQLSNICIEICGQKIIFFSKRSVRNSKGHTKQTKECTWRIATLPISPDPPTYFTVNANQKPLDPVSTLKAIFRLGYRHGTLLYWMLYSPIPRISPSLPGRAILLIAAPLRSNAGWPLLQYVPPGQKSVITIRVGFLLQQGQEHMT